MQELIQKNRGLVEQILLTIRNIRLQKYMEAKNGMKFVLATAGDLLPIWGENELDSLEEWQGILEETTSTFARESYVLAADMLEVNWLSRILGIQTKLIMELTDGNGIVADCENEERAYVVEYTTAGGYTVKIIDGEDEEYYLHSNHLPDEEAMMFATEYSNASAKTYFVYGLGLGYHIKALANMQPEARIVVFESDPVMIELADRYGALDMNQMDPERVTIVLDQDYSMLRDSLQEMEDGMEFIIHGPSLRMIRDEFITSKILDCLKNRSAEKERLEKMDMEFLNNISRQDENADVLMSDLEGKEVLLVENFGSLDAYMNDIARVRESKLIFATLPAARRLLKNNVKPDFVVVGEDEHDVAAAELLSDIPMIYYAVADHTVVEAHTGPHYIAYVAGYHYTEDLARQEGHYLFVSGGDSAKLAVDFVLNAEIAELDLLGYLFSSEKTPSRAEIDAGEYSAVMAARGGLTYANKEDELSRRWIERRISGVEDVVFVNSSDGAYIQGMDHKRVGSIGNVLMYYGNSAYRAMTAFAQELVSAWEQMGYDVIAIDAREKQAEQKLFNARRRNFDFIFAFNAILADTFFEDGTMVQNEFGAPYITMLMEHPLYVSKRLESKLDRYYVYTVDANHASYVTQFFPNVLRAQMLPHGGVEVPEELLTPYAERKIDVLFVGSYQNPDDIMEEIKRLPSMGQVVVMNVIEQMINNPDITVEKGLTNFLIASNISLGNEEFKQYMELMSLADQYVRALYRNLVIQSLIKNNIQVKVFGNGWNRFPGANGNIVFGGATNGKGVAELMANSKIVLNVMPWLKKGAHERVFNAMLCKAVSLTDESEYLKSEFTDGENISFYNIKNLSELVKKVQYLLENEEEAAKIAESGFQIAKRKHTWARRAEEIANLAKEVNRGWRK